MADIGADALGLDWTVNLGRARALVGDRVALQGNLDPAILFAGPEQIRAEVEKALPATARRPRATATCSTWATASRNSRRRNR
jgi:uroporphyrinogen-III decarboxylase